MTEKPDFSLENAQIPVSDEKPEVYAVSDLRSYVKPDLDEELSKPSGSAAICGSEVICSCVPVETCVCNQVSYHTGGNYGCSNHAPCASHCGSNTCVCAGLYWHPY